MQAYSISKLVSPEADHKPLAQGLADALFGQGKVQEAKTIMRAAGLQRKGMKQVSNFEATPHAACYTGLSVAKIWTETEGEAEHSSLEAAARTLHVRRCGP